MKENVLQTRDITLNFNTTRALAGVSLDIPAGEAVAIMGPSGSGKSTLLHCLSGVLTPDSGTVTFAGRDLSGMSDRDRSHLRLNRFGFIFQDCQLLAELPARENVALPMMLTGTGRGKALKTADEVLARLGIGKLKSRLPGNMSGGQAQRVAIARALATNPQVVFADEPTGALDQSTGQEVMQLLTTTVAMRGATLVLVTHDINVARWCSRIVEIRDGLIHSDHRLEPVGFEPVSPEPTGPELASLNAVPGGTRAGGIANR